MATVSPKSVAAAVELLRAAIRPAAVLLFGSAAQDRLRPDSDVDIAVVLGRPSPDFTTRLTLAGLLSDIFGREVDFVVLDDASPPLAMEILREHRVLDESDPEPFQRLRAAIPLRYADLKAIRRPIEDAVLAGTRR